METTLLDRAKALLVYIYEQLKGQGTWATVAVMALAFFVNIEPVAEMAVQVLGVLAILVPKHSGLFGTILEDIVNRRVEK